MFFAVKFRCRSFYFNAYSETLISLKTLVFTVLTLVLTNADRLQANHC